MDKYLFLAQFAAPYKGNFIVSLETLEQMLRKERNADVAYVFPLAAKGQEWMTEFQQAHTTYFTRDDVQHAQEELKEIVQQYQPTLIHTHFDGYDVPVTKVANAHRGVKLVWHMHDSLSYVPHPLKAVYQFFCFLRHYGIASKGVGIISVSEAMATFATKWQKRALRKPGLIAHIPNGIDISRVYGKRIIPTAERLFTFLAFGGRNVQKRIDVLLQAGILLAKQRTNFRVFITLGTDTQQVVNEMFPTGAPEWLVLKEQTQNIAALYNEVDCFVSTSEHETFSYAICEASVFGLPVIQSDIDGTLWNAHNPSTRLFEVNNAADLCEKMNALMNEDKDLLEAQVQQTIEYNATYSMENWVHRIMAFYDTVKG